MKVSSLPDAQFVLCVKVPDERVLLEVMEAIRQSVSHVQVMCWSPDCHLPTQPAYGSAFDQSTHGYLLMKEEGTNKGTNVREWQRYWCVLDGSTLLCYSGEEVSVCMWGGGGKCVYMCVCGEEEVSVCTCVGGGGKCVYMCVGGGGKCVYMCVCGEEVSVCTCMYVGRRR